MVTIIKGMELLKCAAVNRVNNKKYFRRLKKDYLEKIRVKKSVPCI